MLGPTPTIFTEFNCWKRLRARGWTVMLERGDGGERDELTAGAAHVVVEELVGVEALAALDLRDHAVAAAVVDEPVHVAAAQHRAEIAGDLAQVEPIEATLSLSMSISTWGRSNFRSLSAK